MDDFTIEIDERTSFGSRESRRLRREGMVPVVVYSKGAEAISGKAVAKDFIHLAERARPSQVFTLKSQVKGLNGEIALVKAIQSDAVSEKLLHVDLQLLHAGEDIVLPIPVVITGEAPGVKLQGGILATHMRELVVSCKPRNIPDEIVVSVSELNLGDRISAGQVELPEGVELAGDTNDTVVNVVVGRAAKLAAGEEEAGTEGVEGEAAAEGEEGGESSPEGTPEEGK